VLVRCYQIDPIAKWPDEGPKVPWVSEPHELRKRRPPQDWVKLCNLSDVKREEPAHV
jgi:hypothetical protein